MMKLRWLVYLLAHITLILLRYPLAIIAVKFFSTPDKLHLTRFRWLETVDNDLRGDHGWQTEHMPVKGDPLNDRNRIGWLWRNGGNSVNYNLLGCPDDPAWRAATDPNTGWYWCRPDGYWLYRRFTPFAGRRLERFFGWSLFGPQQGRCKFVFTVRWKKEQA